MSWYRVGVLVTAKCHRYFLAACWCIRCWNIVGMSWQLGCELVTGTCHWYVLVAWWCMFYWNIPLLCYGSMVV